MSAHARFPLWHDGAGPCGLLLDAARRVIGEVIEDDGCVVAHLPYRARACPATRAGMPEAMPPPRLQPVRCCGLG